LRLVLKHVRKYICDNRKITLKGASAHALCATIAAAIAPLTGLPELIVIGIVAAVIHFVLTVLKGVFCEMTDAKAVTAMTGGPAKPKRARPASAKKR
jgi:pheromone shutdown protein TraB